MTTLEEPAALARSERGLVIVATSRGEHDDWDAYDRAMAGERRAAALVRPDRVHASR